MMFNQQFEQIKFLCGNFQFPVGVWGDNSYVLDRLVDTYIKNLRKKLHLDCIKTVKGIGYKLEVSL